MALPLLSKKKVDEFSDRLNRAENKQVKLVKQASREKNAKMQRLFKTEGGRQRMMDFIFGKTKVNPLEESKDKKKDK